MIYKTPISFDLINNTGTVSYFALMWIFCMGVRKLLPYIVMGDVLAWGYAMSMQSFPYIHMGNTYGVGVRIMSPMHSYSQYITN